MPAALIQKLEALGYRFEVDGDTIRYRRVLKVGNEDPKPLLLALKGRKAEALEYLRRRQEPHPGDCVCPDCLHPGQGTSLAGTYVRGAGADKGRVAVSIPRGITEASGYETRPWIPAREIDHLWANTRPAAKKRSPILEYIRGRVEGRIPPPDSGPAAAPYAAHPPEGTQDPMDYRWNSERQEWVLEPGWWRKLPGKGLAH